jgi:hypothetical protein
MDIMGIITDITIMHHINNHLRAEKFQEEKFHQLHQSK